MTARHTSSVTVYAATMLLLTAATGALDAVSYLALDRVFTGNMTGNVLFIGFGFAGAANVPVLNNAVAIGSFMTGAAIAARVTRAPSSRASLSMHSLVIVGMGATVTYAVSAYWAIAATLSHVAAIIVTGLLALILGAQSAAVSHLGIREFSTVVVTMTIVGLASDSLVGRRAGDSPQSRRVAVVIAMAVGAGLGAAVWRTHDGPPALGAGATLMTLATLGIRWAQLLDRRAGATSAGGDSAADGPSSGPTN